LAKTSSPEKRTQNLRERIEKVCGPSVAVPMTQASSNVKMWYNTGLDVLNTIVSSGDSSKGLPSGRFVEVIGKEQIGKTTLGCGIIGLAQRDSNAIGMMIDTESSFTLARAKALGVVESSFTYCEEIFVERIFSIVQATLRASGSDPVIIFWDTVAQSRSLHDKGKAVGEGRIAAHAKTMSEGLRKITKELTRSNVLFIACNQLKTGALTQMYATAREKEGTLGGQSSKHAAEVRLIFSYLRAMSKARDGDFAVPGSFIVKVLLRKLKSGTSDSVVHLVMRHGRFDNALSTLYTLQAWKTLGKDAKAFKFGDVTVAKKDWEAAYSDEATSKMVRRFLEDSYAEIYTEA